MKTRFARSTNYTKSYYVIHSCKANIFFLWSTNLWEVYWDLGISWSPSIGAHQSRSARSQDALDTATTRSRSKWRWSSWHTRHTLLLDQRPSKTLLVVEFAIRSMKIHKNHKTSQDMFQITEGSTSWRCSSHVSSVHPMASPIPWHDCAAAEVPCRPGHENRCAVRIYKVVIRYHSEILKYMCPPLWRH